MVQRLSLQNHLDLFGVQSLVSEQSVRQRLVLFAVGFQEVFSSFVRVLHQKKTSGTIRNKNTDDLKRAEDV